MSPLIETIKHHTSDELAPDRRRTHEPNNRISAVDLFCGAGGLTHGLTRAGIRVEAGIDIDKDAEFAFRANNPGVEFHDWDLTRTTHGKIASLFRPGAVRLLAGCAPCQPFSKLTNGAGKHKDWDLLDHFARIVVGVMPELVTMENVPELADRGRDVYLRFLRTLESHGYSVAAEVVRCEEYGVPQSRRRLVLLASRLGEIAVPKGQYRDPARYRTVRQTIGALRPLAAGEADPVDTLHVASLLSPINLERVRATPQDGGSWRDWPEHLVLQCHRRHTGKSYGSIYGRMRWDKPAPTMTTLCNGIGNGRFGHPEQDRAISLREAALLQSFPPSYAFWPKGEKLNRKAIARMIGNAVPPKLAEALGRALLSYAAAVPERGGTGYG